MKLLSVCCLALALIPGCLLVQPLDDPKSDAAGGSTSRAGSSNGSAGRPSNNGGSGNGGSGNGGSSTGGRTNTAGAANGGAPGVDFSLFLGKWTITKGTISTDCGTGMPTTSDLTTGNYDTVTLGTTSDLIFNAATTCPIDADVDDRTATAEPGQSCTTTDTDSGNTFDIYWDSLTFVVGANGSTAQASIDLTTTGTINGTDVTCIQHEDITYSHSL